MPNISKMTVPELLRLHVQMEEEWRKRDILRTSNLLTGDLAEYLFCKAFRWEQQPISKKGFDAVGPNGTRYQIKGRRIQSRDKSRQLSAIRDLKDNHFDILAAVLFDHDFKVWRAVLIPRTTVKKYLREVKRTNSGKFMLRDEILDAPGVEDVTAKLKDVTAELAREVR